MDGLPMCRLAIKSYSKLYKGKSESRRTTRHCGMCSAEDKMNYEKCRMTVISPQVRPCDRSYYTVYRTSHVAGAAVNCVIRGFVHVTIICHLLQSVLN